MQIHIFMAADRRCLWGCAVSMRSVIDNAHPTASLTFHLATHDVPEHDLAVLARVAVEARPGTSIRFVSFDESEVAHLLRSRLITHMTYARLFMGTLLPADVDRVVYIDCDLVFERDVAELWASDLRGHTLGAANNRYWEDPRRHQRRLGLASPSYFSAGVLLVDLGQWRERSVRHRALEFATEAGERLILHDQDALNGTLQGDWLELPMPWNVWVIHPELHDDSQAVFHFMGAPKPWHSDYAGPFAHKFYEYLDRTPYEGLRPWNPAGLGRLVQKLRRRIPYLPTAVRMVKSRLLGRGG